MVAQTRIRRKKHRPLPPGQKLLLFIGAATVCFFVATWFSQRPDEAQQLTPIQTPQAMAQGNCAPAVPPHAVAPASVPFPLTTAMTEIGDQLKNLCTQPKLHAGLFVVDPDTGRYIDMDARRPYSAASMIKLPVLVKLLQAIDAKKCNFDQMLTIRPDLIGGGSGWLQWRQPGTKICLRDTATLMMTISDNTATNMIIDLLGGQQACNAGFSSWGLSNTRINNPLPDLPGTNTTSPYDLALLLGKVDNGELLTPESRAWLFATLEKNKIRSLLPQGIAPGSKIADKTGDIGTLVGDAGVITSRNGKRYIAVMSVERPYNDRRANEMIRQVSNVVYTAVTGDEEGAKAAPCMHATQPRAVARHRNKRRHRS